MKKILLSLLMALAALPVWSQSTATTGKTDIAVERARLAAERTEVDKAFTDQRGICFKRFAVEECLAESRRQKRASLDHIKRQQAILNDAERKRRGGEALDRVEEKRSAQRAQQSATEREQAVKAQQDREQRAADHATGRAGIAAKAPAMVRQYESKQRAHTEQQAKQASRSAEAPAAVQAREEKIRKAEAHRADVEKKNAENTKPRSAPLPPPAP